MDFEEFKTQYEHKPVIEHPNQVTNKPTVSVCVQTYNQANYIKECLEGILMQKTDFPIEILLGEDASSDGTREICMEYAEKHPDKIRLFLHHRENNIKINGNYTGRFNFVYNLYAAKGNYVALCEGDDYWTDPLKLQKQVDFLETKENFSFCFHPVRLIVADGKELNSVKQNDEIITYSKKDIKISSIPTMSLLFRKKNLKPISKEFIKDIPWGDVYFKSILAKNGLFAKLGFIGGNKRMIGGVTDINLYSKYKKSYLSLYLTGILVKDEVIHDVLKQRKRAIFWIYLYKSMKKGNFKDFIKIVSAKVI